MSFTLREFVRHIFIVLFNSLIEDDEPEPPESPVTVSGDEGSYLTVPDADERPHVEVALYQTSRLTQKNGRAPEHTVARFAAHALKRAGFSATIRFGYEPKDPPIESSYNLDSIDWWQKEPKDYIAQDANILIFDTRGGGRGGEVCQTTAGRYINRILPIKEFGDSKAYRNVRNNLHELGHGLSGKHADDMMTPPRMWYNDTAIDDFHENVEAVEESPTNRPGGE